jgi:hypothetical protein
VAAIIAVALAVAGGNLAVTTAPLHPRVGHRVQIRATGQVGDTGRLYIFRNTSRPCADTVRGERRRGIRLAERPIVGSFDFETSYIPRRARREWVCGYLYANSCDAAGNYCGPATGLPPDAGFSQVGMRVRPASQSAKSAAASGRVIT